MVYSNDLLTELKNFYKELKSYKRFLYSEKELSDSQNRYRESLREKLVEKSGALGQSIENLTRQRYIKLPATGEMTTIWAEGLTTFPSPYRESSLDKCLDATKEAIGKLKLDIEKGKRDKQGDLIEKTQGVSNIEKSPINLFDALKLHPKVVEASRSCFQSGHYREAILNSFISLIDYVKDKTGSEDDGKSLMAHAFDEKKPLIKLNSLKKKAEKDEQEGFKFLFMGATVGIRNPKAHMIIPQSDPLKTLEYLALASLLMRRVEEGELVKTKPPRTRWDWERFLIAAKERCDEETLATISRLHDFTKNNASELNWGTGAVYGSFTFRQIRHGRMASIFTVYSDGTVYFSFGSMKNKGVREDILESFRKNLNEIPEIRISQDALTINNKYPYIRVKTLTKPENMTHFQDAVLSLCQQLENSKEQPLDQ